MRKFCLLLMAAVFGIAQMAAQKNATVVQDSIQSKILGTSRNYSVILPPGYKENPEVSYPVLYLLHGMYGTHKSWVDDGQVRDELDRMVKDWSAVPMIIVSPDAGGANADKLQNGYFNLPGWRYEDFFFDEFMPEIEKKYRIKGDKNHRAIAGLSMGGGGTVVYAQKHPEKFCAAYPMSAWLCLTEQQKQQREVGKEKSNISEKVWVLGESVDKNDCLEFVRNATPEQKDEMRSIRWYIDCGDDDFLLDDNLKFYQLLRDTKIPAQLRVRDGAHKWYYWRQALSTCLPFVSAAFTQK